MSYTSKPFDGDGMANRCTVVSRGANRPLLLLVISSMAEGSGVGVPIPILFCADKYADTTIHTTSI